VLKEDAISLVKGHLITKSRIKELHTFEEGLGRKKLQTS
jgi:hypothetical protein